MEHELSLENCQVLCMSRSRKKIVRQYYLHGQVLQEVDHIKYLGVTLTSDATREAHINAAIIKVSRTLGLLRRTLNIGTKSVKEQAYKSFVRRVLECACFMLDPHIKCPEAIQWRTACWTQHRYCRTSNVNDMLTALDWPSLHSRCRCARLSNFYRFHHGLITINSKYTPAQQATVRRPYQTCPLPYLVPYCQTVVLIFPEHHSQLEQPV